MLSAERIPPQNIEAEQSLLGSILLDKDAIIRIGDLITPEDFYVEKHRTVYEAMFDLYRRQDPIDLVQLANRLNEKGELERIGGRAFLIQLSNFVPTASHIVSYANIVHKKATLRRLIHAASDITGLGYIEDEEVDSVLDRAEQKLFTVSQKFLKTAFSPIQDILDDAFERIDTLHKNKGQLRGLPSYYTDLDAKLGGFQKSDLIILAARPSVGKTAFVLDIARTAAVKNKTPVGIFSLEMSKEQLVDRMLCAEANINLYNLRMGNLTTTGEHDDFSRIGHALGVLSEAPIYIDDTAAAGIMEIRTKARRLQMEKGLGLLVIDYLQLMQSKSSGENRVQEVAEITRGLKSIARELSIPVIALSQLSRNVEQSKPAVPKLSHLRESGSIEQDADIVMFIYRKAADPNYRKEDLSPDERNLAEIHIAKHRNGPTGIVQLYFDESRASFKNLARKNSVGAPHAAESGNASQQFDPHTPILGTHG